MIGVFDSGLGGLTILKEIRRKMPEYNYLYLGDTLHLPYGNRSDEAVFELTKKACDYLFDHGCRLIILACNTATAKALRKLQQEYLPDKRKVIGTNLNILGVIRPMAEFIAHEAKEKVGVVGTRGTVNSGAYVVELKEQRESLQVFQTATPLLVPMIEEGWIDSTEMQSIVKTYVKPLVKSKIDTLILGCTHYPMIIEIFKQTLPGVFIPVPGEVVATSLQEYLLKHPEYESQIAKEEKIKYLLTDFSENFQGIAEKFLGEKINIKKVTLD